MKISDTAKQAVSEMNAREQERMQGDFSDNTSDNERVQQAIDIETDTLHMKVEILRIDLKGLLGFVEGIAEGLDARGIQIDISGAQARVEQALAASDAEKIKQAHRAQEWRKALLAAHDLVIRMRNEDKRLSESEMVGVHTAEIWKARALALNRMADTLAHEANDPERLAKLMEANGG